MKPPILKQISVIGTVQDSLGSVLTHALALDSQGGLWRISVDQRNRFSMTRILDPNQEYDTNDKKAIEV